MTKNSRIKQSARSAAAASGRSFTYERRRLAASAVDLSDAALHIAGNNDGAIDCDDRFIRITGAPGTGKTVLAYLLAKEWMERTGQAILIDPSPQPSRWANHAGWRAAGASIATEVPSLAAASTMYIIEAENFTEPSEGRPLEGAEARIAGLLRAVEGVASARVVLTAPHWRDPFEPVHDAWLGVRFWDGAPDAPAPHFVHLTSRDMPGATLMLPRRQASEEAVERLNSSGDQSGSVAAWSSRERA